VGGPPSEVPETLGRGRASRTTPTGGTARERRRSTTTGAAAGPSGCARALVGSTLHVDLTLVGASGTTTCYTTELIFWTGETPREYEILTVTGYTFIETPDR
jgi:hypothetical protein